MKLRVGHIDLVGTTRSVKMEDGLNVVLGDFTTGKTSLMRLLRVLLGSDYDGIIPELARVSHVGGELTIGEENYSIVRRLAKSATARVDVAAGDYAEQLPAMRSSSASGSYGDWLIERLELPHLLVPSAPTRPAESGTQPVSIADYLRYCRLTQREIVADVLGSSEWFKDYKRRVVFGIYFGTYDEQIAKLQEELRNIESEMRGLRSGTTAFDRFLEGTVLANRAALESHLAQARRRLDELSTQRSQAARDVDHDLPRAQALRRALTALDRSLADLAERMRRERASADEMRDLSRQLKAQSARLTKAVVSETHLVNFEFRVCPRCGQDIDAHARAKDDACILCLQPPGERVTREDLLVEQTRVEAQIDETDELARFHDSAADDIETRVADQRTKRADIAHLLDELTKNYVSDREQRLTELAAEQADARARVTQYSEYLALFDKADQARTRLDVLEGQQAEVQRQLDRAEQIDRAANARIEHFQREFAAMVEKLQLPQFEESAKPRAAIRDSDYQPIVNGRLIEGHSGGMAVLINVAYMLALHRTAIELDLRVPSLLMIDGINQNLGRNEYDNTRYELIWHQLVEFDRDYGDRLQMIVATNDVPRFIEDLDVIRLRLTEDDRLVPPQPAEPERPEQGTG